MRRLSSLISMFVLIVIADATTPGGWIRAAEPTALRIVEGPATAAIRSGDRTVLEYCAKAAPMKPYVRELFTPGGVQILCDSPADHKHHHGLMFALGVDGVDFWGEKSAAAGSEKPRDRSGNLTDSIPGASVAYIRPDPGLDRRPRQATRGRKACYRGRGDEEFTPGHLDPLELGACPGRRRRCGEIRRASLLRPWHAFPDVDG